MLFGTCRNGLAVRCGAAAALASLTMACTANPGKVEATATTMALPSKGVKLTDDGATRRAPVSLTASDGTGPAAGEFEGPRRGRGAAGVHRAAPRVREPERPPDRGSLRDRHAARRGDLPLRDEDPRPLAGGRGRSSGRRRASPTRTSCTSAKTRRCSRTRPATRSARGCSRSARAERKELIVSYSQELSRARPSRTA